MAKKMTGKNMSFGYRGRGGPQFGFNPRMRGRGGPGQGFGGPGPRGPGGPRPRWGAQFANMNRGGPGGMNAVPPPGHPMGQHPMQQQWQAMGWNGGGGGPDFQSKIFTLSLAAVLCLVLLQVPKCFVPV